MDGASSYALHRLARCDEPPRTYQQYRDHEGKHKCVTRVAKAGLESTSRYLARELGPRKIRVNLIAAGPIRTMAAKSIPGFATFEDAWDGRAPLGWDNEDGEPVARTACALMSDWFPSTTGEMIHVDGGFHAMGV